MNESGYRNVGDVPRGGARIGRRGPDPVVVACTAAAIVAGSLWTGGSVSAQEAVSKAHDQRPAAEVRGERAGPQPAVDPEERAALLRLWARSYFPGRSGDLLLVPARGEIVTAPDVPFMHGSPWDYDARVPLVLYGSGHVAPGVRETAAGHQDIGATIEALLGLPSRPGAAGRPLSEALSGSDAPPRAIVLLVIDGFRPDYLERYAEETPTLRGLTEAGAWFSHARAAVLPTATAVSHTTMMTAAYPSLHGIVGNTLYDRARGKVQNAYEGASAENVMALTLTDRWSAHTSGRAVIAAQGGTFYPAAALAGHGSCLFGGRPLVMAYFDSRTGGWNSNQECFRLPGYLLDQNIQSLLSEAQGDAGAEESASGARRLAEVFPRFEGEATVEILEMEAFGEDEVTDLLFVNHKAIDYIGHSHGPGSEEMRRAVAEVDRQVGRLVESLERKAGEGGYVLIVTSDHGMPEEPGEEGRHVYEAVIAEVNARFDPEGDGIVLHYDGADNQVYLDTARLEELGVEPAAVARFLEGLSVFHAAFTEAEVRKALAEPAAAPDAETTGAAAGGEVP